MRIIVQLFEGMAVFIPDLLTLALIVPALFGLYCAAIALGLPGTNDLDSELLISLCLGYVFAVALNIVGAMTPPARSGFVSLPLPGLTVEQLAHKPTPDVVRTPTIREGVVIRQGRDLFEQAPR